MTEREKKLLIILGVTFFLILNFIGFNMLYLPEKSKAESVKRVSEGKLKAAENELSLREKYQPEMDWLERSGTTRTTATVAQTKLQAFIKKQASARRLEVRKSSIIPAQVGQYFDRVKVECTVTGMERDVISWLTSIHQVNQRQVVTKLEIKPMSSDPTRVEVEIEIEKWILRADDEA